MSQKPQKDRLDAAPTTELVGTLTRFLFRNAETGFAVMLFAPEGSARSFSAVGQLAQLTEGQQVKVVGRLVDHPRFGRQIEVEFAQAIVPTSVEGIQAYLSSRLIKGVGPGIAERITKAFGTDTLRVIEEEPERLAQVPGLGTKRIDELVAAVRAQKDLQEVMVFLRTYGLGQGLAGRVVKRYGRGASALIQANPYRLVDEVIGVGFRTADQLAQSLGITPDAPERLQAGILHCLSRAARDGHCHLPEDELHRAAAELLGTEAAAVAPQVEELAVTNKIVLENDPGAATAPRAAYPIALYRAEAGAAQRLRALLRPGPDQRPRIDDPAGAVAAFAASSGLQLPAGQLRALERALREPVSVITGGPGVGKTTIVRALTEIYTARDLKVLLAAPTGRAAKRLEESTGCQAQTLHRVLEYQPGVHRFLRDDRDPLDGHMLVVDEASMLDIQLAYYLLRAVPRGMQLVLVGDVDQLPAVGPGNVLADIIGSERVPVTALTEIFRQQRDSRIVQSAHGILSGAIPQSGGEGSDFFMVETPDSEHARAMVAKLVVERIPEAFGLDPLQDVQVLCPMYRGAAGADAINRDLQEKLNPDRPQTERSGHRYRLGDKVMQIRNDYDHDVFNGDTGRITHLDAGGGKLSIRFGERVVHYSFSELDQIVPAYAITVHRAQGSEYPAVVMPLCNEHYMMLRRNLLYTAITRARRLMVLVGSRRALEMAVRNQQESLRHSGLRARLASP